MHSHILSEQDGVNCTRQPSPLGTPYLQANDATRRLFNQAFFTKIYIDEDDDSRQRTVRVDCKQPFGDLLNPLVPAHVHHDIATKQTARQTEPAGGPKTTPGIAEDQSSHTSTLVELRGLEPLTPSLRTRCATNCATAPGIAATEHSGRISRGQTLASEGESNLSR